MIIAKFIAGLLLLVLGAELLVKGASGVANALRVSPLVIGLTVVAFGTSAPEMAVSVVAALTGTPDIALGNVVGSNIFNVLFILGISALITPLLVSRQLIRIDIPVMVSVSGLVVLFGYDGVIVWWEGMFFLLVGVAYTVFSIYESRHEKNEEVLQEYTEKFGKKTHTQPRRNTGMSLLMVLVGLGLLILGSRWLVNGAVFIAGKAGVSDMVIGLTIIAVGTSLPEVATSVMASLRGQRDIAVGNVIGSNIFNILFILGASSMFSKQGITVSEDALFFDIPIMIAVAVACVPFFFTGGRLERWEGGLFLFYYAGYAVYLVLANQEGASVEIYAAAMIWFVIPMTLFTAVLVTAREYRKNNRGPY